MATLAKKMYSERLEQIEIDLRKEYKKGNKKNKQAIAQLLSEKEKINSIINK